MTWVAYLYDTVSGQLAQEIDIPSFTWSMTVSDSSFSTTKDKESAMTRCPAWNCLDADTGR